MSLPIPRFATVVLAALFLTACGKETGSKYKDHIVTAPSEADGKHKSGGEEKGKKHKKRDKATGTEPEKKKKKKADKPATAATPKPADTPAAGEKKDD